MITRTRTFALIAIGLSSVACSGNDEPETKKYQSTEDLVFVADEDSGTVSVMEEGKNRVLETIAIPDMRMPHNVQVSPDGKSVWVAAGAMMHGQQDQAIVIDPNTLKVVATVDLGEELHVAHVVLTFGIEGAAVGEHSGGWVDQGE